jgi:uncharacterized protein (DUF305 family)
MDAPADGSTDLSFDQLMELDRRAAERDAGEPVSADGDVIVLPWWQHPVNIITMVVTATLIAGMIGWMIGGNSARQAHNDVDTGFLQDMRQHHEQAVLMSFIYRGLPDTDPGLRTIARSIVQGQSIEVGRMIQLLREFGESEVNDTGVSMLWMNMSADSARMPGMASDEELDRLGRSSGREADELFVELMNEHHRGGIEMAEFAAENGESEEVRIMARGMASAQRSEIVEMTGQLD